LIGARGETGEPMRAIQTRLARNAAVDTLAVLASKARNAVIGVVTARIDAQTASDAQIALVGQVAAIAVVFATATAYDETTREIIAARRKTDFTHRTWIVIVAQRVHVWTRRAERARGAPRPTAAGAANSAGAGISSHSPRATNPVNPAGAPIDASVQIDGGVAPRGRRDSGFTTAGRSCSDQQNVSKETHRGQPAEPRRSLGRRTVGG